MEQVVEPHHVGDGVGGGNSEDHHGVPAVHVLELLEDDCVAIVQLHRRGLLVIAGRCARIGLIAVPLARLRAVDVVEGVAVLRVDDAIHVYLIVRVVRVRQRDLFVYDGRLAVADLIVVFLFNIHVEEVEVVLVNLVV